MQDGLSFCDNKHHTKLSKANTYSTYDTDVMAVGDHLWHITQMCKHSIKPRLQ